MAAFLFIYFKTVTVLKMMDQKIIREIIMHWMNYIYYTGTYSLNGCFVIMSKNISFHKLLFGHHICIDNWIPKVQTETRHTKQYKKGRVY